jgi:hypothetical protein
MEAASALGAAAPGSELLPQPSPETELLGDDFVGSTRGICRAAVRLADGHVLTALGCGAAIPLLLEGLAYLALAVVMAATLPTITDTVIDALRRTKSKTELFLGLGPMVPLFREET